MPDIYHDFPIAADPAKIFRAISTPEGLDAWWTRRSSGEPAPEALYELWFAPEYDWRGRVVAFEENAVLVWEISEADEDWTGTHVGFELTPKEGYTQVRFHHTGWPELNDHFRRSSYCWAMYLRVLKAYVEDGKKVSYEHRQDPSI